MYQFVMLPEKSDGIDASGTTLWQEQIFTRDQVRILHACRPNAEKPEAGNVTALFVFLQFKCLAYRGVIMHCHVNQTLTCLHGPSHTHISTHSLPEKASKCPHKDRGTRMSVCGSHICVQSICMSSLLWCDLYTLILSSYPAYNTANTITLG